MGAGLAGGGGVSLVMVVGRAASVCGGIAFLGYLFGLVLISWMCRWDLVEWG